MIAFASGGVNLPSPMSLRRPRRRPREPRGFASVRASASPRARRPRRSRRRPGHRRARRNQPYPSHRRKRVGVRARSRRAPASRRGISRSHRAHHERRASASRRRETATPRERRHPRSPRAAWQPYLESLLAPSCVELRRRGTPLSRARRGAPKMRSGGLDLSSLSRGGS